MEHILMHKDIPVLSFDLRECDINSIHEIITAAHLPVGISNFLKPEQLRLAFSAG